ncbi:MAG: hypothetical protein ABGW69_02990 [Nanoarchaeota archaeon]
MIIFKPTNEEIEKYKFLIEELKEKIPEAEELIRKGLLEKKIRKKIKFKELEINFMDEKIRIDKKLIINLAKNLIKLKKKKRCDFLFAEDYRYLFDCEIAELRANYLKNEIENKKFADLSCGYGVQSFYFLNYANEAILIDINSRTLFFTFLNSILLDKANKITLIKADSEKLNELDKELIKKIKELDFIYSESYRKKGTKELNLLKPNPLIIKKYNKNLIFDISPLIEEEQIANYFKNYELATIEDKKGINRLIIYQGFNIKRHFILEEEKKIVEGEKKETIFLPFEDIKFKENFEFFELYKSVEKLKLNKEIFYYNKSFFALKVDDKEFIKNKFKVIAIINLNEFNSYQSDNNNNTDCNSTNSDLNFSNLNNLRLILRFKVNSKNYYREEGKIKELIIKNPILMQKIMEKKKNKLYVFKIKNKLVICENLNRF